MKASDYSRSSSGVADTHLGPGFRPAGETFGARAHDDRSAEVKIGGSAVDIPAAHVYEAVAPQYPSDKQAMRSI
jgi:hypothetical protein